MNKKKILGIIAIGVIVISIPYSTKGIAKTLRSKNVIVASSVSALEGKQSTFKKLLEKEFNNDEILNYAKNYININENSTVRFISQMGEGQFLITVDNRLFTMNINSNEPTFTYIKPEGLSESDLDNCKVTIPGYFNAFNRIADRYNYIFYILDGGVWWKYDKDSNKVKEFPEDLVGLKFEYKFKGEEDKQIFKFLYNGDIKEIELSEKDFGCKNVKIINIEYDKNEDCEYILYEDKDKVTTGLLSVSIKEPSKIERRELGPDFSSEKSRSHIGNIINKGKDALIYSREKEGPYDLYMYNIDNKNKSLLVKEGYYWIAPDGKKIAYLAEEKDDKCVKRYYYLGKIEKDKIIDRTLVFEEKVDITDKVKANNMVNSFIWNEASDKAYFIRYDNNEHSDKKHEYISINSLKSITEFKVE